MKDNDTGKLTKKPLSELSELLSKRTISSEELTREYLSAIAEKDSEIGAYITVCEKTALDMSRESDKRSLCGERLHPLDGIPYALKDNICTIGVKTTCASRILEDFVPPYDAFVSDRLKKAGCVCLGKLNMDEFAMGSSTENSAFGATKNPLDISRVPGGSSGGSAASVAAGMAAFALGSDTGGSIRQPSAFCGVVGMKPTYGRVSRNGLCAFASSLDALGPITRNARDNAIVLETIAGHDVKDATSSINADFSTGDVIYGGVKGMKFALPKQFIDEGLSSEVRESVLSAARVFESHGACVDLVSMPELEYALAAYYVISSAEASSNLARFDGVRFGCRSKKCGIDSTDKLYMESRSSGFGTEVKRRILLGTFVLSSGYYDAYYKKAKEAQRKISVSYNRIFEKYDMLLSPTAPETAYKIGEKLKNPKSMYKCDLFTVPASLAGIPSLSIPCGKGSGGLPVGLLLTGRAFSEATLYRTAAMFEEYSEVASI